jgi:hypothetical protein
MDAHIRKLYNGRFYVIAGHPSDKLTEDSIILGDYNTRRQALRYAKKDGHEIIIRNRSPVLKKSLLDNLDAAKQKVADQKAAPRQSVAKSRPSTFGL